MTHCLKIILHRSHIQGGLTNEEVDGVKGAPVFTDRMLFHLYDFWKIHITNYVNKWKEYKNIYQSPYSNVSIPNDQFSDIYDCQSNQRAKFIQKDSNDYIIFPITENNNINNYIENNTHFYLYDIVEITDTTIEFIIYWIPNFMIENWYNDCGNNGKINIQTMKGLIYSNTLFDNYDEYYV